MATEYTRPRSRDAAPFRSPHRTRRIRVPPPSSITQIVPPPLEPLSLVPLAPQAAFGTNVRVNSNPASLSRPQVEPSVASKPGDPLRLVAGFADFVADAVPGVARSTNGGRTWSAPGGGPVLPNPPGFTWGDRTGATSLAAGDSSVAWGLSNVVHFSTLGFHNNAAPPNNDCSGGGIYVYLSTDSGDTWTLPANGPALANTQTIFRDKEYIAADANPLSPFAGNLYMVWSNDNYSGCPQSFPTNFTRRDIAFAVSSDGGSTWSAPLVLATGCLETAIPAVAANGDVYVVWFDCNAGIRQMVRKSSNGGVSFQPAVAAASALTAPPNPLAGSSFRVNGPFPAIATDPTNPLNVYVAWSSNNGTSQTDVFVSRSLNGGTSWSPAPVRVNDDPVGNPRDQFMPWIAVLADGTVEVMWGDDRLDLVNSGGKLYDIFVATSGDEAATFGPNVRVTAGSSNPDLDGFGGTFIGDYFGLSASGVPVWDDEQSGNQDIFGAPHCLLDVDLDGRVEVSTDVVYIARRLQALVPVPPSFRTLDPMIPPDSTIAQAIEAARPSLDVDANGRVEVSTDVVYIARRLSGLVPVPPTFRTLDPTIPPDSTIAARIDMLCLR